MTDNEKYSTAMVVVAHADDAEWGCSGTVALWCKKGMDVVYVVCTDGSKGSSDPDMTSERLVKIRHDEQLAAAKVLGVKDVVFLGYEDSMLQPTIDLRRDIVRQIRKFKPDVLITSYPSRSLGGGELSTGHPDHIAAGEAALSAVFPSARDRLTFPELIGEGLEPHKVKEVLIMSRGYGANRWIEVTDTIETSIEALKQHKSQVSPESAETALPRSRREVGKAKGILYAESFKSFRFR